MTADEYIQAVITKNPAMGKPDEERITLTCRGLRALIRQAHHIGMEHEKAISAKMDSLFGNRQSNPFSDIFNKR